MTLHCTQDSKSAKSIKKLSVEREREVCKRKRLSLPSQSGLMIRSSLTGNLTFFSFCFTSLLFSFLFLLLPIVYLPNLLNFMRLKSTPVNLSFFTAASVYLQPSSYRRCGEALPSVRSLHLPLSSPPFTSSSVAVLFHLLYDRLKLPSRMTVSSIHLA